MRQKLKTDLFLIPRVWTFTFRVSYQSPGTLKSQIFRKSRYED